VPRIPWQLVAAVVLLALLATLATLQYRWLGEVSEAERERMRATLRTRASDFAVEFDAELTRTYLAFHVDDERLESDPAAALADAFARLQSTTVVPGLVRAVYIFRRSEPAELRRFDSDRRTVEPTEWPPELSTLRDTTAHLPGIGGPPAPIFLADVLDSRTPALVIAIPRIRRVEGRGTLAVLSDANGSGAVVIVVLDRDRLLHQLL